MLFGSVNSVHEFDTSPFLIQCLFEAKVQLDFKLMCKANKCSASVDIAHQTPLDAYALGCTICLDS
jgi:hypothetical protein